MSDANISGEASGQDPLHAPEQCKDGTPGVVPQEVPTPDTHQVTQISDSPHQGEHLSESEGDNNLTNVTKDCTSDDDSTKGSLGEMDESKSATGEKGELLVQSNIASEVVSALADIESVGSELKTAFKDVHNELISAESEVKSEISHVLTNSQFKVGAFGQKDNECDSNGEGDNADKMGPQNIASESLGITTDNIKDVDVRKTSASGECCLQKDDSQLADSDSPSAAVDEGTEEPDSVRRDDEKQQTCPLATPEPDIRMDSTDPKSECGVENPCIDVYSALQENSTKEFGRHIAVAEEVTEELFRDVKIPEEEENHFEVNQLLSVQVKQQCSGREGSMMLLSSENGRSTQTVSAPSTPVPSTTKTARKVMRTQGCRGRRVSFPEDETHLISSYLEPVNPWQQMEGASVEEIASAYKYSCDRHSTQPLPGVLQQIKALPLVLGGRVECLSLRAQRLDGSQCEGLEEIFRRVQFKILDLEGCCLDDDTAIPLFDMIEFYDSAMQLNISCNEKIGFRGWQACARMLKRTPSVEYLDARNTNLNETNMPILGRALRLGARLHTLHLENCNLTGRPLTMLTAALRQNDTLAELYLAENRLGINDCIQLGNLVRANSTLLLLDLRNNNVQDTGCGHVCEGISGQQKLQHQTIGEDGTEKPPLKGLKSLVLWNNHLTQQSTPHLANMLGITRSLETLNLGRNNLTSEGVLRLKESLLRNRALLRLGLQAARVGDEGAVALAEYAADNTVIQHMDLRDNPIRVAGLMALAHSLRHNSTIIQLDIDSDPKSEPAAELAEQHATLQREIKEICQRNLTQSHVRAASQPRTGTSTHDNNNTKCPKDYNNTTIRKISLTCETTSSSGSNNIVTERIEPVVREEEKQKYISPAPSPIPSPSPSPCASPVPSPLKNRFRVFKVCESSKSSPDLLAGTVQTNKICHAVPVSQSGRSLSAGDLSQPPPKQAASRPNRFSVGGRFTVTRVAEPSGPCSLPDAQKKISSITTLSASASSGSGPKIVISSPVRVERGFSVEEKATASKVDLGNGEDVFGKIKLSSPVNLKSVDLPEDRVQSERFRLMSDGDNEVFVEAINPKTCYSESSQQDMSSSQRSLNVYRNSVSESQRSERDSDSVSSSDLTDSGFLDEGRGSESSMSPSPSSPHPEGDRDSLLSSSVDSTNQEESGLGLPLSTSQPSSPLIPCNIQPFSLHDPPKRAPLAAMENGSFDSDSEDSEVTTQSSDSTHSDEVRITAEQYQPKPAWGSKPDTAEVSVTQETLTSGSAGSG
ncbi:hypothetical protein Pcinc_033301 [Petrolisthes cinctipes]|uniref:Protein phosphatase 1 regulatory subunit 37 n=1 Tax=Petrolisthes cinctipes TaxID=88211 RepID=A0AAE1JXN5_PETCI|nr:hypothetical protein Pcinc_033301 [Petrolisthes cinctipes]